MNFQVAEDDTGRTEDRHRSSPASSAMVVDAVGCGALGGLREEASPGSGVICPVRREVVDIGARRHTWYDGSKMGGKGAVCRTAWLATFDLSRGGG